MSLVGRAFGSRQNRQVDPAPSLGKVLAELEVSEQEVDQISAPEPPATQSGTIEERAEAHRKRLATLLSEAQQLERKLAEESAQASALAESLQLNEKRMLVAERISATDQAEAEAQLLAAEHESAQQAQAAVEKAIIEAQSKLADSRSRARTAALRANEAKTRAAACREAQDLAEKDLRQAETIAESIAATATTLKRFNDLNVSL